MAIRQPAGVCLGIAPWNAPVILGTRAVAMAIACGNTVVLKASELCPGTHRLIGQVLVVVIAAILIGERFGRNRGTSV